MNARSLTIWCRLAINNQTARRLAISKNTRKRTVCGPRGRGGRMCRVNLHQIRRRTARARTTWRPKLAVRKSTLGRHPASPERPFCPPGKRSPGQGSGAAGRCPTRRPAGLRRGITCQPTRLEGPSLLLQHPAAPWARGASTSRCCRRRPNPYLRSAPNKNLRGRRQAGT